MRLPVDRAFPNGCLDEVHIDPHGIVRLVGWSSDGLDRVQKNVAVLADEEALPLCAAYSTYRPDVARSLHSQDEFLGVALEFRARSVPGRLRVLWEEETVADVTGIVSPFPAFTTPHYDPLLHTEAVMHRDDIYCSGPPATQPSAEALSLARGLPGPILDFGCGSGALVRELRRLGLDASGIEIDRSEIHQALANDVREWVTVYDGRLPLPFGDGEFASVTAFEVLEHIPDYRSTIRELFRVARERVVVTVPDMAAVPMLAHRNVVPWHLLEKTHVNFFTQRSLAKELDPYCRRVAFARINTFAVDGQYCPGCLVATCTSA